MNSGDILLLEAQLDTGDKLYPVEILPHNFDAIRLAVANNIIVIEAAGNGNLNLDNYMSIRFRGTLNRHSPYFRDSGSIMVGASGGAPEHDRLLISSSSGSNYGTRIDCFAQGLNVTSCGYGDLTPESDEDSSYTSTFSGTSSASSIIAGAAILTQQSYEQKDGVRLSPLQMRSILSSAINGTPQGDGVSGHISFMPDLRTIIENNYNHHITDIYIRDYPADSGSPLPYEGELCESPDVFVLTEEITDIDRLQLLYGSESENRDNYELGHHIVEGQDHYVYVRIKNRGNAIGSNVTAKVFYSEPSTLITPNNWQYIGETSPINVEADDRLYIPCPIQWNESEVPEPGHYCFIAVIENWDDPIQPVEELNEIDNFSDFIKNNNNIAWRNFFVLGLETPSITKNFFITGAPDDAHFFDLEILNLLSVGTQVWLVVDISLGEMILQYNSFEYSIDYTNNTMKLLIPNESSIMLPNILLHKEAKLKAQFIIEEIKEFMQLDDCIAIRQLYNDEEVGRITWQFK
jgi:hypothetical protein